ncbi:helix-turn-helix domain-containing protein [Actinokineospora iranica]|uniref:DNA-binding transcriptional regulator, MerR family n=1 Tax=Actinokineospora iranica TaxID=1271860 RepID=A0A1G6XLQ7_9PSEU|nr:helix-turn-helix domain-containing protein [Actinokineospora iranica]SDD79080.1 DNA-binding transcriptional regulator, MerR family [Actinokineospora iranica]
MGLSDLDDEDYPAYTTGQAADLLGVRQAFLRGLDAAGMLVPHRSSGGHRRYSRRQLAFAVRFRALFDDGHTRTAAARILRLEDDLAAARTEIAELRVRLGHATTTDGTTTDATATADDTATRDGGATADGAR